MTLAGEESVIKKEDRMNEVYGPSLEIIGGKVIGGNLITGGILAAPPGTSGGNLITGGKPIAALKIL